VKSFGEVIGGKASASDDDNMGEDKDEDLGSSAKKAAVKALFSAMKADDVDGGVKAMGAFYDAC